MVDWFRAFCWDSVSSKLQALSSIVSLARLVACVHLRWSSRLKTDVNNWVLCLGDGDTNWAYQLVWIFHLLLQNSPDCAWCCFVQTILAHICYPKAVLVWVLTLSMGVLPLGAAVLHSVCLQQNQQSCYRTQFDAVPPLLHSLSLVYLVKGRGPLDSESILWLEERYAWSVLGILHCCTIFELLCKQLCGLLWGIHVYTVVGAWRSHWLHHSMDICLC